MGGKALRLKRFQRWSSGRMVILPLDHGVSSGPISGIQRLQETVQCGVQCGADALVLYKGMLKFLDPLNGVLPGVFVHLSASTQLGPNPNGKVLIGSVEEALRLGADGVSLHINLGDVSEPQMLRDLGVVAEACLEWGLPLLVMIYVRSAGDCTSPPPDPAIAHAARVAAELGADIIKIPAPDNEQVLREITASLPVPVVLAGGIKSRDTLAFLVRVEQFLDAGAGGVAVGRNVFQDENPGRLLTAVCRMVHGRLSAHDAWLEYRGEEQAP